MIKNTNITTARTTRFIFTMQLGLKYNEQEFLQTVDKLDEKCKLYSSLYQFQLERGVETSRYHIQGFIMCDNKMTGQALVNRLNKKIGYCQKMISASGWDYTEKHETAIKPELFRRTRGSKIQLEKYFKDPNLKDDSRNRKSDIFITAINSGSTLEQVEQIDPAYYAFNSNVFEKQRLHYLSKFYKENYPSNFDPFRLVFYITGSSGVGKNKMLDFLALGLKYNICYVTDYYKHPFDDLQEQEFLILNEYRGQFNKDFFQELIDKRTNINLGARYHNKRTFYKYVFMTSPLPYELLHNYDYNKIDNRHQLDRRVDYIVKLTNTNKHFIKETILNIILENKKNDSLILIYLMSKKLSFWRVWSMATKNL